MDSQGNLDLDGLAQARKEANLEAVAHNAGTWIARVIAAARDLAASRPGAFVTGETLRQTLEPLIGAPHHHNAWGAAIATLVRSGTIKQTGRWVPMKGPKSNARRTPEYILEN